MCIVDATNGGSYTLQLPSLGHGGEGEVFRLNETSDLVFKRYKNLSPGRFEKLDCMIANQPVDPTLANPLTQGHASLAWPTGIVEEAGVKTGFLMRTLKSGQKFELTWIVTNGGRRDKGLLLNFGFILDTAANFASAVASIHDKGYVVGDLKLENVLVTDQSLVTLIDLDSIQVKDPVTGVVHFCPVITPDFAAPELADPFRSGTLSTVERTQESDLFTLAVLMYMILADGQHPYAQDWSQLPGLSQPDYIDLIQSGQFPYLPGQPSSVRPSPLTWPFAFFPDGISSLFLRAFGEGHLQPSRRPTAKEWSDAIRTERKQLVACPKKRQHFYFSHFQARLAQNLEPCFWCHIRTLGPAHPIYYPDASELAAWKAAGAGSTRTGPLASAPSVGPQQIPASRSAFGVLNPASPPPTVVPPAGSPVQQGAAAPPVSSLPVSRSMVVVFFLVVVGGMSLIPQVAAPLRWAAAVSTLLGAVTYLRPWAMGSPRHPLRGYPVPVLLCSLAALAAGTSIWWLLSAKPARAQASAPMSRPMQDRRPQASPPSTPTQVNDLLNSLEEGVNNLASDYGTYRSTNNIRYKNRVKKSAEELEPKVISAWEPLERLPGGPTPDQEARYLNVLLMTRAYLEKPLKPEIDQLLGLLPRIADPTRQGRLKRSYGSLQQIDSGELDPWKN